MKPRASQSDLGDYKLYSLDEPTTVAARQTKQVLFLHQDRVKFDKVYVFKLGDWLLDGADDAEGRGATTPTLRLENKPEKGLGRALPAGAVSIRQSQGGAERFLGQPDLRDVPVGEPFELEIGQAADVQASWRIVGRTRSKVNGQALQRSTVEATLTNAKTTPVTAEVRMLGSEGSLKVLDETSPHTTKAGDPVWSLTVPAGGEASVTCTVERGD